MALRFRIIIQMFFLLPILLTLSFHTVIGQDTYGKTFIISPNGSDSNLGIATQPLATLEAARDAARMAGPGNHRIIVMPGKYYLSKPIELDSRDNGLTIEADTSGAVIIYGGIPVTNWRRDGEKFWCAELAGVKEGNWDFRALVVDGHMPERARMPETGTFIHESIFDVPWLSTVGGGWARKPSTEELTTMSYNPNDIPETLDIKNAEVRVYHMWNESLIGVERNDIQKHKLIFSQAGKFPPGGFGIKKYVVWNTREGMTKPGRWYLDRSSGRLVYWPLDNEDMNQLEVIAPTLTQLIKIDGELDKKAENITIRGLILQATTTPLKSANFGGTDFDGALSMTNTNRCSLEKIEICNVGGIGICAKNSNNCHIRDCHIHNTGACSVFVNGSDAVIEKNYIHNAGIYYPGSTALYINRGKRIRISQNELHDVPYCGMIFGAADSSVVENNLIYRAMREMQDGAAIYCGGISNCTLRGNIVRDIVKVGTGYGVSAYYLDEGSHNCIVEKNVSLGVLRPTHNHIARNTMIRDNFFMADEDMTLSFLSSDKMAFEGNTIITSGKIGINGAHAVSSWKGNKLYSNALVKNDIPQAFTIDSVMPYVPVPEHKTDPIIVRFTTQPPTLDGNISAEEWPGDFLRLDRKPTREPYSGAPVITKFSWDNKFLYVGAIMAMFDVNDISQGDKWGKDDGVEISIRGYADKNKPVIYVIRAYYNGTIQSVTDAGAPDKDAKHLEKEVQFVSKIIDKPRNGWMGEWAIPFDALGIKPNQDMKIAFNMCAFVNEYDNWHCWEGTLGASWQVDQAGILQLKK